MLARQRFPICVVHECSFEELRRIESRTSTVSEITNAVGRQAKEEEKERKNLIYES